MGCQFSGLVDVKRVKSLVPLFRDLTGLPSALIDPSAGISGTEDGDMAGAGWESACLDVRHIGPRTGEGCARSDADTVDSGGRACCCGCLRGLVDAVAEVVAEGRRLVDLITGPVRPEPGRTRSRSLAMVSHELRSPLQNLEIYRTLLERALAPGHRGAAAGRVLAGIAAAAERMAAVVTTILQYGMIRGGRITVEPAEVRLDRLAAEVVAEMAGQAGAKGLVLEAAPPPKPLPPLTTDPRLLRLVLANLVDNAVKYSERGRVTVALGGGSDMQRCTVADTGIGIRAEDSFRIFEAFEQVEAVSHKHTPGIGLGLAVVRDVAGLLGGRIELESTPGQGSAFSLVLPAVRAECTAP